MVLEPDDTQSNYFWYLGPIPDDYYNAFINVPVNNYWLLAIIPEEWIHLEVYFEQLVWFIHLT